MAGKEKTMTKIVKPLPRGQITIPVEFRKKLKIGSDTILSISLKGNRIEIIPATVLGSDTNILREYTDKEISQFLKDDKIDKKTADNVKSLLAKGNL